MNRSLHIWMAIVLSVIASFQNIVQAATQLPDSDLAWRNIAVDGKKQAVFCLYADSRGLVWLGTNSGLYFYDGVSTHPVGDSSMDGVQIYSMVESGDGLLLGSNNGLLRYDFADGVLAACDVKSPKEIRSLLIIDDELWIGSIYGLYALNLKTHKIENRSKGLKHKSTYSLLRDSRGIIYAGTYNGLARWDGAKGCFAALDIPMNDSQKNVFVNSMLESADGKEIYIGTEGALYHYTPSADSWGQISAVDGNNIKSLAKTSAGHLLVGTDNGIFELFDGSLKHYRHDSRHIETLSDNEVWSILCDGKDNIFAGHENGFSIASSSSFVRTIRLGSITNSGEGNEIHSIVRDRSGNLWLGGLNGVVLISDHASPRWFQHSENNKSLSHNHVRTIVEDSDNEIWLCTDGGLNRYNPASKSFDIFHVVDGSGKFNSNWVYDIAEYGDKLWVGSYLGGLHCVDKHKFQAAKNVIESDFSINSETRQQWALNDLVNQVEIDSKGNVWVLLYRDNSLLRLSADGSQIKKIDIFELTGSYPVDLLLDSRERIWCAFKGGCVVLNGDGDAQVIKFPYTGGDETIMAMGTVGDDVWMSTASNVWCVDGKTLEPEALPIPQQSYTSLYEDRPTESVILGGKDEIVIVNPKSLEDASGYKQIKMVLRTDANGNFTLGDLRQDTTTIKVPYGGRISLMVSTLDYAPETANRFVYKLGNGDNDVEGDWIVLPDGANTITLTDLTMGKYDLLIKVVGSPLDPISVRLVVIAPWYLSWWAIAVYVLLLIGVIAWIAWFVRRKNIRKFEEREREKELENVEQKLSFLSNISHDLKTPLSMIIGPVSLMKERAKTESDKKSLEMVYDNAVRLNTMIHRALELEQMDDVAENMMILSLFDVVDFCKGVFDSFRDNNPQKNFVFHSSCKELVIEADAVKFESVIVNLLSNAVKYSDEGSTISCGISADNGMAQIVVSDDGVGIPEQDQSLVFQRMFRSPSTAKMREGTGLGLYLIKKYLEMMHGNIELFSQEGQGTTFIVTLPMAEKAIAKLNKQNAQGDSSKPKVLVVEDNMQISAFIGELLAADYTCLFAENGRTGLSLASSFMPDLIIADEMMPIMKGLDMVAQLKKNPRLATVPIIMLTAKSDHTTEVESARLGVDVFMAKPFEPSVLLERVKQLLSVRKDIQEKARISTLTEAKPIEAESVTEKQLASIAKIIEDNISDPDLNVNYLCEKSGISNKQMYRIIKKYMGVGPLDYIRRVRLQKAAMLLAQHRFTVSEVGYMVGFKTPSYFAKCFQAQFGVTPSEYKSEDESPAAK